MNDMMLRERPAWSPLEATVPYQRGFALRVPEEPGVYIIHDVRGALYVGKSVALRRRFDEHFFEAANPLLATALGTSLGPLLFSWKRVAPCDLDAAERDVIRFFKPACNRNQYSSVKPTWLP